MTQGILDRAWTITANQRKTYVSLNATAAWWFFRNHEAIRAKMTLKWTSDGVTGPSGAGDTTNRLLTEANCNVRATIAGAAQSWAVYTTADGVQILICYQGATDDVMRIGYSVGGLYTLAGTSKNQPTATDECFQTTLTVVGTGTVNDRVMSIWLRDDGKGWRSACFSASVVQSVVCVDKATSLATVRALNPIFTLSYFKVHLFNVLRSVASAGGAVGGSNGGDTTTAGILARVYTSVSQTIGLGGGEVTMCNAGGNPALAGATFQVDKPAAQNGEGCILLPIFWSGMKGSNTDGFFACPIDWWCGYASTTSLPASGQLLPGYDPGDVVSGVPRSRWLAAVGASMIWPWRNAAVTMEIL